MRFLFALVLLALVLPAQAQSSGIMPFVGYNLEDEDFTIGVGGRFALPLQAPVAIIAQPSIEYQFAGVDDLNVLQFDANVVAQFTGSTSIAPYAGAGLGVLLLNGDGDSESELGLNVLGGVVLNPVGFGQPFAQVRYSTRGDASDAISVQAGVLLSF